MSANTCIAFADDTSLINLWSNLNDLTLKSTNIVAPAKQWFTSNNLNLNEEKTQNFLTTTENSVKLLGVAIDDRLKWSSHIEQLSHKLSSSLFIFGNLKGLVSMETLRMRYFELFHSHISYGTLLWGNANKISGCKTELSG